MIFDSCLHQLGGVRRKEVRLSNDKRTLGTSIFFFKSFAFDVLGLVPVRDICFSQAEAIGGNYSLCT